MTNLFTSKKISSRVIAISTLASIFLVLNVSGAMGTFWRTLDNVNPFSVPQDPSVCKYGYGYGDNGWWYGYGYGYGYGTQPCAPSSNSGSSYNSFNYSPGGWGGGGWFLYNQSNNNKSKVKDNNRNKADTTKIDKNKKDTKTSVKSSGKNNLLSKISKIKYRTTADWRLIITKLDGTKITFSDVNNTFAKEYITILAGLGVINGYGDGTFKPERNATRAEYLKMVLGAMGVDYSTADVSKLTFADVDKNSWIAKVVAKASELGLINTNNKNFRPNDKTTRAEGMKMLLNAAGIEVQESTTSTFSDVSGWAIKYIETAKNLWIVNGQEVNGKLIFRPNDNITRAEVTKIIVKTMLLP